MLELCLRSGAQTHLPVGPVPKARGLYPGGLVPVWNGRGKPDGTIRAHVSGVWKVRGTFSSLVRVELSHLGWAEEGKVGPDGSWGSHRWTLKVRWKQGRALRCWWAAPSPYHPEMENIFVFLLLCSKTSDAADPILMEVHLCLFCCDAQRIYLLTGKIN